MAYSTSTSVRFDDETNRRLDTVTRATGLTKGDLVRMAVDSYLKQLIKDGHVIIQLPQATIAKVAEPPGRYSQKEKGLGNA